MALELLARRERDYCFSIVVSASVLLGSCSAEPPGTVGAGSGGASGGAPAAAAGAGGSAGSSPSAAGAAWGGSSGAAAGGTNVAGVGGTAGSGTAGSGGTVGSGGTAGSAGTSGGQPRDVTFFVVADTHADPVESYDLRAMARAIDALPNGGVWPATIGGVATGFTGGAVAPPSGVVFVGDITGWGTAPAEIPIFRRYFDAGTHAESMSYPAYIGLGNHDISDADRSPELGAQYRAQYWTYVDTHHKGSSAKVPVKNFDAASHSYSWEVADVHFVMTQRFPGDVEYGLPSNIGFLEQDLATHAGDGRPVVLFHHYGMDAFGTDGWWTADERATYRSAIEGYNVAGIFVGHSHGAFNYEWEGLPVFQVNNAKAEITTGNKDGNGSFAVVRITEERLEVMTCRWLDDSGKYELVGPHYSAPLP